LTEEEARRLLLVRAVESADTAESVLTREDRIQASAAALTQSRGGSPGPGARAQRAEDAYLARRSEFAFARIAARFPQAARAAERLRWPSWVNWLAPAGALVLGVAMNELDSGRRLNIIAFPLLGMIAWNLAVYASLATHALRKLASGAPPAGRRNVLARLLVRPTGGSRTPGDGDTLGRALTEFTGEWVRYAAPLTYSRASRTLHLSAAALAAGVLMGMYLRALAVEYRAGWESTFIDAGTLSWLLGLVLGPASAISGISLPGADHLQTLRWSDGSPGENAGRWIHLYAVTAVIFIIGPRLLLAGRHTLRAFGLRRRFPVPGTEDFYIRQLLRGARGGGGGGGTVRVIPYGFHPPDPARRGLEQLLGRILGEGARVSTDTPVDYGEEDEWLAGASLDRDLDHLVVLFNLSGTPEAETHGALLAGIRRRLVEHPSSVALTVLVEESSYRQRLGAQAGADARLRERRRAWEAVLAREGVLPTLIDLGEADADAVIQRLEGALIKTPALIGGGAA